MAGFFVVYNIQAGGSQGPAEGSVFVKAESELATVANAVGVINPEITAQMTVKSPVRVGKVVQIETAGSAKEAAQFVQRNLGGQVTGVFGTSGTPGDLITVSEGNWTVSSAV